SRNDRTGKPHGERCSVPSTLTCRANRAPVELDDVTDDGEPQTETAVAPCRPRFRLLERLEEVRKKLAGDPLARIGHGYLAIGSQTLQGGSTQAVSRGDLARVGDQVPDDLLDTPRITRDGFELLIGPAFEPDALGIRCGPSHLHTAAMTAWRSTEPTSSRNF